MPSITFLGAAGTVTGSRYLVRRDASSLLVDCGLFQGYKNLRLRNRAAFPVDPAGIGAVALTHAHLDHSGYLPLLVRNGFRGPVHCTRSTLERLAPHDFDAPFETAGMRVRFSPAGHILGAAIVTVECGGRTLVFSGDLGRRADPVMRPPAPVPLADILVLESTYGDRHHDPQDPGVLMGRAVADAARRGGTIVIPCFAVGRAQSVLLHLHRLKASGTVPASLPVYLDSPMATDVTALYLGARAEHRLDETQCRALSGVATIVRTPDESRALDESAWPKVIIAGSGMASGGRILHHIRRYGPDPRSLVLFTGFQVGGTRGEAMVKGAPIVKIHGAEVPIRARVVNVENLSAHADRDDILAWLGHFRAPPARTLLVHGEPGAADALRRHIGATLGWDVAVAEHLQSVELDAARLSAVRFA